MNSKIVSEIIRANVKFKNLIRDEIRRLKLIKTGTMIRSITTEFKISNNKLEIVLGAVYYYDFLDDGTKYIKPYNITKNVIKGQKFKNLEKDLIAKIAKIEIIEQITKFKTEGGSFESTYIIKNR